MPFNLPFFSTAPNSYGAESQEDIDMYNAESEGNFRGIESHLRSVSSYQLTDADLCSDDDVRLLSVYGAFAELSHGCFDVGLIWQLMPMLLQPGGMLEEYGCLENSKLLCVFKGANWAGLQGYVVHRWADDGEEEILVSFSGTSNLVQGLYDVWALKTGYPIPLSWQSYTAKRPKAHAGFWSIYSGLRATVAHEMAQARKIHPGARRLVITGHSLGAAMCYLAALDILFAGFEGDYSDRSGFRDMSGMQIVLAVFGCPRVGNEWLVSQYQAAIAAYKDSYGGQLAFIEYSVKGFQDGAFAERRCIRLSLTLPIF